MKKTDISRCADGNDIGLVILGRQFAFFSTYKLTKSSGKHLEDISLAHVVSLKCKPITSAKDSDNLSTGFSRDCRRRQHELTNYKNKNGKQL